MTTAQTLLAAGAGAALTALAVSLFVLREALLDLRAVNLAGLRNGRRIVAVRALEAEVARSAALILFALAAGGAFTASVTVEAWSRAVVIGSLVAFLLGQVVLAVDAARALRARRELLDGPDDRRR